jgi:hypothetical protein
MVADCSVAERLTPGGGLTTVSVVLLLVAEFKSESPA